MRAIKDPRTMIRNRYYVASSWKHTIIDGDRIPSLILKRAPIRDKEFVALSKEMLHHRLRCHRHREVQCIRVKELDD